MPAYTAIPLEQRLVDSAKLFIATAPALAALEIREADQDGPITPKGESPKILRLIVTGLDEGRHIVGAPIRNLRLRLAVRGNAKTPEGEAEGMHTACAALERLLDDSNLLTSLDSAALGIRVLLATRRPGSGTQHEGMIRRHIYELELRAVASERATA